MQELVRRAGLRLEVGDFGRRAVGRPQLVFDEATFREGIADGGVLVVHFGLHVELGGSVTVLDLRLVGSLSGVSCSLIPDSGPEPLREAELSRSDDAGAKRRLAMREALETLS